ncbi:hypothetical protein L227DRAFT_417606 [Lentinus tigrinus ALCF2SS1-6]|uniref:Uncharacterized protein n=1 Tax=Lentinus tigrinus ALCF2SS1-6 TaxID=1328759 RepID=A0A5C2SIZ7_9APHY|nr:hypothetical protein L227DRAFT_417606 [Lentinus tigrinus ALCF2SS1-6]
MTAHQKVQSLEDRKARYSQELAAYTLRQWDLVRQGMEDGTAVNRSSSQASQRERSVSTPRDSERSSRMRSGIQAHDYAQSAHQHMNGGRAVTAGHV